MSKRVEFEDITGLISMIKSPTKHNLVINDEQNAEETLRSYSYYTIMNGYKHVLDFKSPASGDISFEHFSEFHLIDTTFNSIVLRVILLIEKSFKSRVSYLVAKKYGVDTSYDKNIRGVGDYLSINNYSSSSPYRNRCLLKLKEIIINPNNGSPVHYYKKNKANIPPWILAHNLNLGQSIYWYKILVENDKDEICNQIIDSGYMSQVEKKELLVKSIDLLHEFRNKAAHGSVIITNLNKCILPNPLVIDFFRDNDIITSSEYLSGFGAKDFYSVFLAIFILFNDKQVLYLLVVDVLKLLLIYEKYDYQGSRLTEIYKFPIDFSRRLLKLLDSKGISYPDEVYEIAKRVL